MDVELARKQWLCRPLTLADVAALFVLDLPTQTEADLARMLGEIQQLGSDLVGCVIEPLARAELARRRMAATVARPASGAST